MANSKKTGAIQAAFSAPKRWIYNIVAIQEKKEYNFYVILLFACFVGLTRFTLESILTKPVIIRNIFVINFIVFYLNAIFVYTLILKLFIPKQSWRKSINIVLIGVFLGIFPPAIDVFIYGMGAFGYDYSRNFPNDWNIFLFNENINFTYGETITLFLTIFFTSVVVYIKTGKILRTIVSFIVTYGFVVFIVQVVSSIVFSFTQVGDMMPAYSQEGNNPGLAVLLYFGGLSYPVVLSMFQLMLIAIIYFILNPTIAKNLLKRLNHALPAGLTCLMGYGLQRRIDGLAFIVAALFLFAFIVAIVQNDYFDRTEDEVEGRPAYLGRNDVSFFNAILLMFAALLIIIGNMSGYFLLLFAVVSFLYNYDFYRGKKYFPSNNKIEGIFGVSSFLGGICMAFTVETMISSGAMSMGMMPGAEVFAGLRRSIQELWTVRSVVITFLVFGGWFVVSIFKDYKDIKGDTAAGNQTVYTMLGKRGRNIYRFHTIFSLVIFALLLVPPVWFTVSGLEPFFAVCLVVTDALLLFVITRKNARRAVELGFLMINIYLMWIVVCNQMVHMHVPAQ